MSRSIRVSFFLVLALASGATGAMANVPVPEFSTVPEGIVLSPGDRFPDNPIGGFAVHVEGPLGAVAGSFVEIEFSPGADEMVQWCLSTPGGGGAQVHPVVSGTTDINGDVTFEFYGGGCLDRREITILPYIVEVRADCIPLQQPNITSPDIVNELGKRNTDSPQGPDCDLINPPHPPNITFPAAVVSLSDAVEVTPPIVLGLRDNCVQFVAPFNTATDLGDATVVTPYIKAGSFCECGAPRVIVADCTPPDPQ